MLLAVMVLGLAKFAPAHSLGHYFFRAAHDGPADCYSRRAPGLAPEKPGAGRVLLAGGPFRALMRWPPPGTAFMAKWWKNGGF